MKAVGCSVLPAGLPELPATFSEVPATLSELTANDYQQVILLIKGIAS